MPTRLTKPVARFIDTPLRSHGFRLGFTMKVDDAGVWLKPPYGRWSHALFASWSDVLMAAATRRMEEQKAARIAKRRAKGLGLT